MNLTLKTLFGKNIQRSPTWGIEMMESFIEYWPLERYNRGLVQVINCNGVWSVKKYKLPIILPVWDLSWTKCWLHWSINSLAASWVVENCDYQVWYEVRGHLPAVSAPAVRGAGGCSSAPERGCPCLLTSRLPLPPQCWGPPGPPLHHRDHQAGEDRGHRLQSWARNPWSSP